MSATLDRPPVRRSSARLGSAAGMVAPVMFLVVLGALDVLDSVVDVSLHELGRAGWLMHFDFFAFGLLVVVFGTVLGRALRAGWLARLGAALIWIWGLGPLLATFTLDWQNGGPPTTWHGTLHFIGFLLMALAPLPVVLLFAWLFKGEAHWRGLALYSLATGIALIAIVFGPPTSEGDAYPIWTGPASMLELILACAWLEVVAFRLWLLSGRADLAAEGSRCEARARAAIGEQA